MERQGQRSSRAVARILPVLAALGVVLTIIALPAAGRPRPGLPTPTLPAPSIQVPSVVVSLTLGPVQLRVAVPPPTPTSARPSLTKPPEPTTAPRPNESSPPSRGQAPPRPAPSAPGNTNAGPTPATSLGATAQPISHRRSGSPTKTIAPHRRFPDNALVFIKGIGIAGATALMILACIGCAVGVALFVKLAPGRRGV